MNNVINITTLIIFFLPFIWVDNGKPNPLSKRSKFNTCERTATKARSSRRKIDRHRGSAVASSS